MNDMVECSGQIGQCRPSSVTERLRDRKQILESELARVNETLKLLESQPAVSEVLDSLAKLNMRL